MIEEIITVAICTYRRYELLNRALGSFSRQTLDRRLFRVLVVDNTDDAEQRRAFAASMAGEMGIEVATSEPPGLSRARNVAMNLCRTPFIAFMDDDAIPDPKWLEALVAAFRTSGAAVVAGPIEPEWPRPRPSWVPDKYIACLTVLDYGPESRPLSEFEFAYGTNMAFDVQALRGAGGFDVSLGRTGNRTLLSDEEIRTQLEIKRNGKASYYAADARVTHLVHENRIRRNYFRSRMAWQAVSTLIHDSPLWWAEQSRDELMRSARALGIEVAVERLACDGDSRTFGAQIDFIYHLLLLLLNANTEPDEVFERLSHSLVRAPAQDHVPARHTQTSGIGRLVTPISNATKHLFVDASSSHAFLYDAYGDLPASQLVRLAGSLWDSRDTDLDELLHLMEGGTLESVTFLSLEAFVYGPSWPRFKRFLTETEVPVFGILHRFPWDSNHASNLQQISSRVRMMVLAEAMAERLKSEFGLDDVEYLPLHPTHASYVGRDRTLVKSRIGARPGQVIFSALGEARKGKGIELMLDALDRVPPARRREIFVLLGGRAKDITRNEVCGRVERAGYDAHVALRSSDDPLNYAVLSERELGEFMNATDVGMLLYQEDQRNCMSGVLPNYAWGNRPVIATRNSIVGRLAAKYNLGVLIENEDPNEVAAAMVQLVDAFREGDIGRYRSADFRRSIERSEVIARLSEILRSPICRQPGRNREVALTMHG
ncbi:MAG: glycosyltransferase [Betaproteobacteria bacterium]|nr:glycosyltransferase [Betaproteobacteria bacterium]MBL8534610.1 glycosyltransferase [Betaproteobacteria bacterium]